MILLRTPGYLDSSNNTQNITGRRSASKLAQAESVAGKGKRPKRKKGSLDFLKLLSDLSLPRGKVRKDAENQGGGKHPLHELGPKRSRQGDKRTGKLGIKATSP